MLPILQAEDQLRAIDAAALGGGHVKPRDARRALHQLQTTASGGRRKPMKPSPAMLAAAGFIAQELVNHKPILETLRLLLLLNESEMDKEFGLNLPSGDIATIERELETGAADTFFK